MAQGFSRDGSFGLKPGFSGPAVVPLPTYAFRAGAVVVSQRMWRSAGRAAARRARSHEDAERLAIEVDDRLVLLAVVGVLLADLQDRAQRAFTSKPLALASANTSLMSSAMAFFSSSRRSMRSMRDLSCSLANPAGASGRVFRHLANSSSCGPSIEALHRLGVTFVLDRAGVTGPDGPSHNGQWDHALAGIVPGLWLAAPRDEPRLVEALARAVTIDDAPSVVRTSKESGARPAGRRRPTRQRRRVGVGAEARVLVVGYGQFAGLAVEVAERMGSHGIPATVVDPVGPPRVVRPSRRVRGSTSS